MKITLIVFAAFLFASCSSSDPSGNHRRQGWDPMYKINPQNIAQEQTQLSGQNFNDDQAAISGNRSKIERKQDMIAADIRLMNDNISAPTPLTAPVALSAPVDIGRQDISGSNPSFSPSSLDIKKIPAVSKPTKTNGNIGRCQARETWTQMRDESFACCPTGSQSCYNPCEIGERATHMRNGTYACCPSDSPHCYPLR